MANANIRFVGDNPTWDLKFYGPEKGFSGVCQNVRGGHYARFLVKDASACSAGGEDSFEGDLNTFAQCYFSTDDPNAHGGATFDPVSKKGTCSGNKMGVECVWSVKVAECDESDSSPPPYCSWTGCDGIMQGGCCDES